MAIGGDTGSTREDTAQQMIGVEEYFKTHAANLKKVDACQNSMRNRVKPEETFIITRWHEAEKSREDRAAP